MVVAMVTMGAVVREVVTSTVLANARAGASSPAWIAKAGASFVGRIGCMRELGCGNTLRRRAQFVNRAETKGLVSASSSARPTLLT